MSFEAFARLFDEVFTKGDVAVGCGLPGPNG
jgi:hypothetical protein